MKIICTVVIILGVSAVSLYGEVFRLRNGETVEGELVSADAGGIIVKIKYGTIRIDRKEIISGKGRRENKETLSVSSPVSGEPAVSAEEDYTSGLRRWLVGQINPKTGLLESYNPTSDVYLDNQAATYDQALAGLAFLALGDKRYAEGILSFYKSKWNGNGFSNFYFTPTGSPGIEGIEHLGPNMWIALLAMYYDRAAGKKRFFGMAEEIIKWAMSLPHYHGGAAMSAREEWRASWDKVVSTENNIDYYAVLNIAEDMEEDKEFRERIRQEKLRVKDFLKGTVYDWKTGGIFRGFHSGVVDREYALDTVTWLILAVGPEELSRWGIDIERLIGFMEDRFLVRDKGIEGFDFTDRRGAFRAKRARMISVEWTLGAVNAYYVYAGYYNRKGNGERAERYRKKAVYYTKQMSKLLLRFGPKKDLYACPYATRSYWLVFYDSPWWKTPKAAEDGTPAGSVAGTVWMIFAGRVNPLNVDISGKGVFD